MHAHIAGLESKRLERGLRGGFKESYDGQIELDEDPQLITYFLEYLYQHGSTQEISPQHELEYVLRARLYTLGDRLQATGFQIHVLKRFLKDFHYNTTISDWIVCDLLEVACDELPDRVNTDPLKDHIYWYVAGRLDRLGKFPRFADILCNRPSLGKDLCLRAGNSMMQQPPRPSGPAPIRFKKDGIPLYGPRTSNSSP